MDYSGESMSFSSEYPAMGLWRPCNGDLPQDEVTSMVIAGGFAMEIFPGDEVASPGNASQMFFAHSPTKFRI
jgi:hypothetical protein